MKKKLIIILSIVIGVLVVLTLAYFLVLKPYLESKKDLTYGKYRDSFVISENRNLESFLNDDTNAVVVFWATWCSHCVEEAEDLNNFITSNPQKKVIIVSHDYTKEDLEKYLNEKGYNWFVIIDTDKTIRENLDPGSKGIPSSYLVNKDKNILNFHKGKLTLEQFNSFSNGVEI